VERWSACSARAREETSRVARDGINPEAEMRSTATLLAVENAVNLVLSPVPAPAYASESARAAFISPERWWCRRRAEIWAGECVVPPPSPPPSSSLSFLLLQVAGVVEARVGVERRR